jgi:preprotein translocase subunit YajC
MNELLLSTLIMAAPSGGAEGGDSMMPTLIMFGSIFFIMYFLMIRPQQKRQKETQKMLSELKNGDKVITSSGMHGRIISTDDKTFLIEVADKTNIRFERAAVSGKPDSGNSESSK